MTTHLLLVRHGETALAAADRFAGATDAPLTAEGHAQARRLGARLAGAQIRAVYASPLARTVETARAIAEPHGLVPVLEPALREVSHGHWETLTHAEAARAYLDEYAAWKENPFVFGPEGGESGLDVLARALPALRAILGRHAGETIVVVSHKATLRLLFCALLGIDPRRYRDALELSPASLTRLDVDAAAEAKLVLWNDVSHLEAR